MKIVSISVTDAARNFSDCVNRVRYQQTTFILHKNGIPVARIVPEGSELPHANDEPTASEVSAPRKRDTKETTLPKLQAANEEPDIFLG